MREKIKALLEQRGNEAGPRWRHVVSESMREWVIEVLESDAHDAEVCSCSNSDMCRERAHALRAAVAVLKEEADKP